MGSTRPIRSAPTGGHVEVFLQTYPLGYFVPLNIVITSEDLNDILLLTERPNHRCVYRVKVLTLRKTHVLPTQNIRRKYGIDVASIVPIVLSQLRCIV